MNDGGDGMNDVRDDPAFCRWWCSPERPCGYRCCSSCYDYAALGWEACRRLHSDLLAACEEAAEDLALWVEEHRQPCDCSTCHALARVRAAVARARGERVE